jgi:hypothetical protein
MEVNNLLYASAILNPGEMAPGANSEASYKWKVSCFACRPLNSLVNIPTEMYKIWFIIWA